MRNIGMNIISISFYFTIYNLIVKVLNNDLVVDIQKILVYNLFACFNNYFQGMSTFEDMSSLSADEERVQKEERQKKHYFFLSQLQDMARDLPVCVYNFLVVISVCSDLT